MFKTRMLTNGRSLMVLAGLVTAMATAAAPAHGGPAPRSQQLPDLLQHNIRLRNAQAAQLQFQRGMALGRSDGWAAGYRDGLAGKPFIGFCSPLAGRSVHFAFGYEQGFSAAYAAGYRQGQLACHSSVYFGRSNYWPQPGNHDSFDGPFGRRGFNSPGRPGPVWRSRR